jgi:hypothetical protein
MRLRESEGRTPGEVDERLKSHAWKACIGSNLSGVRIPLSPPKQKKEPPTGRLFLFGGEKQAACAACAGDSKGTAYRRALSESPICFCRAAAEAPRARVIPPFRLYLSQPQSHPDRAAKLPRFTTAGNHPSQHHYPKLTP